MVLHEPMKHTCHVEGCERQFRRKQGLERHITEFHNNVKLFKCSFKGCSEAFSRKSGLILHERNHTGEKPIICSYCDKAFKNPRAHVAHERTHTGEKPYACTICDMRFTQQIHMKLHQQRVHAQKWQQFQKKCEQKIAKCLSDNNIDFKREHVVNFSCTGDTYARIDFVMHIHGRIVFLEVDEEQHDTYGISCDVNRMVKIMEALALDGNTIPVVFIRYNPHGFSVDGDKVQRLQVEREKRLINLLTNKDEDVWNSSNMCTIQYMFYDIDACETKITKSDDYPEHMAGCCAKPII